MLNIPYEVKQALRKGCYKKNYKFKVYKEEQIRHIAGVMAVLSENDNTIDVPYGDYVLYNENNNHAFDSVDIVSTGGAIWIQCPVGDTETWLVVHVGGDNGHITINGFNANVVYLTSLENISYTSEKVLDFTIDNDTLVSESVRIDERMVTGKQLKFGLCEGSSLEFQYFDHPNINGKDVQVYCSVEYIDGNGDVAWYDIPMGWYTVDQCPRQWSTGIYKVTAYNKLKSDYLDSKANNQLIEEVGLNKDVMVYDIRKIFLKDYQIIDYDTEIEHDENVYSGVNTARMVYFSSIKGIATPFNAFFYEGQHPLDDPIYLRQDTRSMKYIIDSDIYWYVIEKWGTLSDFEKNIINIIKEQVDSALLYKSDKNTILTGDAYIDEKLSYGHTESNYAQFCRSFGAEFRPTDGDYLYFSDYAYNYETVHNLAHIVYPYSELINKTRNMKGELYIYFPWRMELGYAESGSPFSEYLYFDQYNDFIYTKDDYSRGYYYFYPIKYPNGMEYVSLERYNALTIAVKEELSEADKIIVNTSEVSDFTLRDITSAAYETLCQYGKLDRETDLFSGVELNQGGLLPADNLYPANDLYPQGDMEHPFPSSYQKLWTDTVGEQSFRYLFITYKTTETVEGQTQEVEKVLQRTVNTNGTTDYNMSDNWLFRNLIWTDEDVGDYADAMVTKMQDIRWFPFEMWAVGMPYIETGDAIEITDKQGNTHTSYVLTRTLNGIQNLQDTFVNGELNIF